MWRKRRLKCKQAECERRLRRMGYVDNSDSDVCDSGRWACMAAEAEDLVAEVVEH
jgi:hypothetical protein